MKGSSPVPASYPNEQHVGVNSAVHSFISYIFPQSGEVPWRCGDPYRYGPPKTGNSWTKCHELTEKYDNDMCEAWKDEVDKLLVFVRTTATSKIFLMLHSGISRPVCSVQP